MSEFKRKYSRAYRLLAKRLREARETSGFTQDEVAKLLNVSQSFVAKCESGERRIDVVELRVLASLYSKDLSYFENIMDEE